MKVCLDSRVAMFLFVGINFLC